MLVRSLEHTEDVGYNQAMTVGWPGRDRSTVQVILDEHPFDSGRCADAAREVLPIAQALDPGARAMKLEPASPARYLLPLNIQLERNYYHHVTVRVVQHHVDALTGADGTPEDVYLVAYWQYPNALAWSEVTHWGEL